MERVNKRAHKILIASLFILTLSFILYDLFFGKMGFFEYLSIRKKYELLEERKMKVTEEIEKMEKEEKNLKENLNFIEDIARRELGLIREREKIIILDDEVEKRGGVTEKGAE